MNDQSLVHIVDDEDAIRRSLDFLLRTAGYRVERWSDGESFLEGVERSAMVCVLLDVQMPGLDGLAVHARMREAGLDFPVILLTGHGDIALAVQAMKAGVVDFLEKPFDREQLLRAVDVAFVQNTDRQSQLERTNWARAQLARLTEREREVLDGLACGYPNKTIGFDLGISSRTVEVYRANVMTKLEVGNFADALRIAFAGGLGSGSSWRDAHAPARKPRSA